VTKPKVTKTTHTLPFDRLDPKCLWLVDAEGYLDVQHYGLTGNEQGRDIIAKKNNGASLDLWYFQAKREKRDVGKVKLKREVDKIVNHWRNHPTFRPAGIVFISASTISSDTRDAVTEYCLSFGLTADYWAHTELDLRVKKYSAIIREFFDIGERDTAKAEDYRYWLIDLREYVVRRQLQSGVFVLNRPLLPLQTRSANDEVAISPVYKIRWLSPSNSAEDQTTTTTEFQQLFNTLKRRVLLLGEPGAGKTTTLMLFADRLISQRLGNTEMPLPIYIPLSSWKGETPLIDWIQSIANLPPAARNDITRGNVVLLLDGFDELRDDPDPILVVKSEAEVEEDWYFNDTGEVMRVASQTQDDSKTTEKGIQEKFLEAFRELSGIPILITCRERDYHYFKQKVGSKLSLEAAVVIESLSDTQLEIYLEEYPALWDALSKDKDLRDVVRTPLMLRLFTDAYSEIPDEARTVVKDISTSPTEIKEQIIQAFVERRYEYETLRLEGASNLPKLSEIQTVLGELAVREIVYQWYNLEITLQKLLGDRTESFMNLCHDMHIIQYTPEDRTTFSHRLIRDYFAVPELFRGLEKWNVERETIIGLGRLKERRVVSKLTKLLQLERYNFDRREIIRALGEIGDPFPVSSLIALLATTDQEKQREVEWALAKIGVAAKQELIDALKTNHIEIRASVAWIIARVKIHEGTDELIACLRRSKKRIKLPLIGFISGYLDLNSRWRNPSGVPLKYMEKDVDRDIYAYCGALTNLQESSVTPLVELYRTAELLLKQAAIWSLARMNYDERVVDILVSALEDSDDVIRSFAAAGLGWLKAHKARESLIAALNRERGYSNASGTVFNSVLWALGCTADDIIVSYLLRVLAATPEGDKFRQYCILGSLGISGNSIAFDGLLPYLDAEDDYVRSVATQAISRLRVPAVLGRLTKLMFDPDYDVQRKAATGIAMLRNMDAAHVLIANLPKVQEGIRYYIFTGLIHMQDKRILDLLYPILETDSMKEMRQGIENAIRRIERDEFENEFEDAFFIE
jgi:HEAT repeat protein